MVTEINKKNMVAGINKKNMVAERSRSYKAYKNSDVEWLGEVPEHWEVKKFKFVLNQSKGLTITKQNLINEGVFCVNYGEIHSKYGFELNTTKHKLKCVHEDYLKTDVKSLLNKGDFIFADTSEDIEGSGNFTHLTSNDKIFAGYHTVIARSNIEIISLFLAFVFDSISFRNQIRKKVKGVKVYSITQTVLKETNIWIPPLKEQTIIAQFLYDKTTKIDEAISLKDQQIQLLKERKQILIHKAVTRGLNDTVKLKNSGVEWIGDIPEHWEVVPLVKYSTRIDYRGKTPEKVNQGIFLVTTKNIKEGLINYEISKEYVKQKDYKSIMSRGIPKIGDLLFTMEAPLGQSAVVDVENVAIAQRIIKFRFIKDSFDSYFANYFIQTDKFQLELQKEGTGSTALGIKASKLHKLKLIKPPLQEQKEISTYIETASQKIETAIDLKQQEIAKLKEYKSSLINSVVTGKVKVC